MEDSPILLVFLIIYLIAASSGKKQKAERKKKAPLHTEQKRKHSPMRAGAQGEMLDWRSILRTEKTFKGFEEAFNQHVPRDEECERQPIHLHEVAQEQMEQAAEGEDPCHAGGYDRVEGMAEGADVQAEHTNNAFAQDVLRGVIMSEILTRPQERIARRAAGRQNGHGYHG